MREALANKPIKDMTEEEQREFFADEKQINKELKSVLNIKTNTNMYYRKIDSEIEHINIYMRGLNQEIQRIGIEGVSILSVPFNIPGYYDKSIIESKYWIGWVVNSNFLVLPSLVISKFNPYFFDLVNKDYSFFPKCFKSHYFNQDITVDSLKTQYPLLQVNESQTHVIEDPLSLLSADKPSIMYKNFVVTPLVRRGMLANSDYDTRNWLIPRV